MRKQIQIFISGVMVVAPFAVTGFVVWKITQALEGLGRSAITAIVPGQARWLPFGAGILGALLCVYVIGLLTHVWVFRWGVRRAERLLVRLPLVKTIYEAMRDVMGLFGGQAGRMGQVVRYRVPGTEIYLLGIRTSTTNRLGVGERVAVYLPLSYQFAGITVYVPPESVEPVEMSVEEALKVAATAGAGGPPPTAKTLPAEPAAKGGAA